MQEDLNCGACGGFLHFTFHDAGLAQLVEQLPCKHQVVSSSLTAGTKIQSGDASKRLRDASWPEAWRARHTATHRGVVTSYIQAYAVNARTTTNTTAQAETISVQVAFISMAPCSAALLLWEIG